MYVKVCGLTRVDDALEAIDAGADALGFNFIPVSKRHVAVDLARTIIDQVRDAALCVGVVANCPPDELRELARRTGVHRLQLHGDETPDDLEALGPLAFKALRIGGAEDVATARRFGGHPLLVDAKVPGQLGGTGHAIDWPLVEPLARERPLLLAGGLTSDNVRQAVSIVEPWGVDVASGVESPSSPRRKDANEMRRFIRAARAAASRVKHEQHAASWLEPE